MPTYSYACSKCGHAFDRMKAIQDMDKREKCEQCGAVATRQLTFPTAIVIN